jgi:hypothetical protein
MLLYFEFDDKRVKADVTWPKDKGPITVHLTDAELTRDLPSDLLFDVEAGNKVSYTIEDRDDKRLIELQDVISRRLQEFVNKS